MIRVDGRHVAGPHETPWWDLGTTDRFPLGHLAAGPHTVEVESILRSHSLYSLLRLELDRP